MKEKVANGQGPARPHRIRQKQDRDNMINIAKHSFDLGMKLIDNRRSNFMDIIQADSYMMLNKVILFNSFGEVDIIDGRLTKNEVIMRLGARLANVVAWSIVPLVEFRTESPEPFVKENCITRKFL